MGKIEELLIRKKSYEDIALFLGVSTGFISQCVSRAVPRKELRECSSFRDLIQSDSSNAVFSNYTISQLNYVKEHELTYFKELLRNDYIVCDKIHIEEDKSVLKRTEIEIAISNTKSKMLIKK